MTGKKKPRRKPKVSYRELLQDTGAAPGPAAPPPPDPAGVPEPRPLPPARRRDRSRELTPRELAAVLNEGRQPEEIPPAPAAAARPTPPPPAEAHRASIASDTMEFAVASAAAALPFRDRVKARLGAVDLLLFRVGDEYVGADLAAVEEVVDRAELHPVPEAPPALLGMFHLRGRLLQVYTPEPALGTPLGEERAALLVLRHGERRIAIAISDVLDVVHIELSTLREPPAGTDPDGLLLGVTWHAERLVAVIDVDALAEGLIAEPTLENV